MSSTSASYENSCSRHRASAPVASASTANVCSCRPRRSRPRRLASSSTTRIRNALTTWGDRRSATVLVQDVDQPQMLVPALDGDLLDVTDTLGVVLVVADSRLQ